MSAKIGIKVGFVGEGETRTFRAGDAVEEKEVVCHARGTWLAVTEFESDDCIAITHIPSGLRLPRSYDHADRAQAMADMRALDVLPIWDRPLDQYASLRAFTLEEYRAICRIMAPGRPLRVVDRFYRENTRLG